jgi:ketosteroid isomerase-like protein
VQLSNMGRKILIVMVAMIGAGGALQAADSSMGDEKPFVAILEKAYQASCSDVDRLHNYYRSDAQIIHDGRQTTLDETIKEIKESIRPLQDLRCTYHPRVRTTRVNGEMAYVVVRETLRLTAKAMEPQEVEQICSYIFMKDGSTWKIILDHCSTVPGETV